MLIHKKQLSQAGQYIIMSAHWCVEICIAAHSLHEAWTSRLDHFFVLMVEFCCHMCIQVKVTTHASSSAVHCRSLPWCWLTWEDAIADLYLLTALASGNWLLKIRKLSSVEFLYQSWTLYYYFFCIQTYTHHLKEYFPFNKWHQG